MCLRLLVLRLSVCVADGGGGRGKEGGGGGRGRRDLSFAVMGKSSGASEVVGEGNLGVLARRRGTICHCRISQPLVSARAVPVLLFRRSYFRRDKKDEKAMQKDPYDQSQQ